VLSFSSLHFLIPGTHADMTGQYSLDGSLFDFHGTLKLDAKLSQMMTGWKSILLKPVDPFFHKNGAGTEVPFKVTGTRSEPHFGLDFGHKEENKKQEEDKREERPNTATANNAVSTLDTELVKAPTARPTASHTRRFLRFLGSGGAMGIAGDGVGSITTGGDTGAIGMGSRTATGANIQRCQ